MTYFTPDPKPPEHRCPLPLAGSGRQAEPANTVGTHWRCDCGKAYVVALEHQHSETWTEWQRTPEYDIGDGRG